MRYDEALAKYLLERILTGSRLDFQLSQSNGEHDFDLYHPHGRVSVVEVTCALDQNLQWKWCQILDKRKGGATIGTQLRKMSWSIHLSSAARIDLIRKNADKYLAAVEAAGMARFNERTDDDLSVRQISADLGVTSGSTLPDWVKPTRILMGLPGPPGKVGASTAIKAAEHEALKRDNRRKLGAHMGGERHLAVYAPRTGLAWFALWMFEPPPGLANLPNEISHIWIFGESGEADEYVVWQAKAASPWQKLTIPFTA